MAVPTVGMGVIRCLTNCLTNWWTTHPGSSFHKLSKTIPPVSAILTLLLTLKTARFHMLVPKRVTGTVHIRAPHTSFAVHLMLVVCKNPLNNGGLIGLSA
jgi:hypothetical protein